VTFATCTSRRRGLARRTVLGQGAQATQDTEPLETVTASHPETIRTMKWAVHKLKEASPQVLAA